jgi:hypothetical protein
LGRQPFVGNLDELKASVGLIHGPLWGLAGDCTTCGKEHPVKMPIFETVHGLLGVTPGKDSNV